MISLAETQQCPRVSVVSPFFNEEAIIGNAIPRLAENLARDFGDAWEMILVNDGSGDGSLAEAKAAIEVLSQHAERVAVFSLPVNQGRGRALKAGIDQARAPVVVTTEVDCSWGDDIVLRLYREMEAHGDADAVIASPHLPEGGFINVPGSRVALSTWGNFLIRRFFDSNITMNTGMTRAYRTPLIQRLDVNERGKEFHLEVLLKLLTIGCRVREIPATIDWQEHKLARAGAPTRKSSTRIARTIGTHLRFLTIAHPVRSFAWLAAVALFGALGFMLAALWALFFHETPSVFFALIGLSLLVSALILGGFSVLFSEVREVLKSLWIRADDHTRLRLARDAVRAELDRRPRI